MLGLAVPNHMSSLGNIGRWVLDPVNKTMVTFRMLLYSCYCSTLVIFSSRNAWLLSHLYSIYSLILCIAFCILKQNLVTLSVGGLSISYIHCFTSAEVYNAKQNRLALKRLSETINLYMLWRCLLTLCIPCRDVLLMCMTNVTDIGIYVGSGDFTTY